MLDDIQERLSHAKERLRRKQKLDAMLHEAQVMLDHAQRDRRRHEQTLANEKADVQKLEQFSLTGVFYSVLGTKDERLETERQEYLAARLKHEECEQAVGDARQEVARLESELGTVRDAEREYDRLIEKKRNLLVQSGDQRAEKLLALAERLAELEADRKELLEAIGTGDTAQRSLERVRSELQSAENWGTWDMLGGGTISTWAKHSQIDSAKQQAQVAQRHLRRFREELADADQRLHVSLDEIGGFSTFADYFFDGLIADWVVQSKIQNASEACRAAISKVASAIGECRRGLSKTEEALRQVETERRTFIEQA